MDEWKGEPSRKRTYKWAREKIKKWTTGQERKEEEKGSKPRKQGSMEVEEHGLNNEQSHILSRWRQRRDQTRPLTLYDCGVEHARNSHTHYVTYTVRAATIHLLGRTRRRIWPDKRASRKKADWFGNLMRLLHWVADVLRRPALARHSRRAAQRAHSPLIMREQGTLRKKRRKRG